MENFSFPQMLGPGDDKNIFLTKQSDNTTRQGSVTFSDQVRPTGCFSDTSCSSQMKDGQERGKEPESGTGILDRPRDCMETGASRHLDATRARQTGRGKREKKNVPIRAEPLVRCLFRVRPFSERVLD